MSITITDVQGSEELSRIRELFEEYAKSLAIDLCFQNFTQELNGLPGAYGPPEGRLLIARNGRVVAGCVAFRKIGNGVCEMKRLYVRPGSRKQGAGRLLAVEAIQRARQYGYRIMRLDTLSSMQDAIRLYESLGFIRIEPYYSNPSSCAVFMELDLSHAHDPVKS